MKIDELIEKYYEGETNPEEENFLQKHFAVSDSESPEKDLLGFFAEEKEYELDDSFDLKVLEAIEAQSKVSGSIFGNWRRTATIAASIVLLFTAGWFAIQSGGSSEGKGIVITDDNLGDKKEIALAEAESAFSMLSSSFETADENLNKLEYINKSYDMLDFFNMFEKSDEQ